MQKLQIKNMVCLRCVAAVEDLLKKLKIDFAEVRLGEALTTNELNSIKQLELKEELKKLGFELLNDKSSALINRIKILIIEQVQSEEQNSPVLSEMISKKLNRDYSQLSKLFSSTTGVTIEQFAILQKIEKVKELLIYDQLSLKEIAFRLRYSSTAHLSTQFKKTTGLSPTAFKTMTERKRKPIDEI